MQGLKTLPAWLIIIIMISTCLLVSNFPRKIHREQDFHSLHYIYRRIFKVINHLLTISHVLYWKNIWESQGDHVIVEFALYRTAL